MEFRLFCNRYNSAFICSIFSLFHEIIPSPDSQNRNGNITANYRWMFPEDCIGSTKADEAKACTITVIYEPGSVSGELPDARPNLKVS